MDESLSSHLKGTLTDLVVVPSFLVLLDADALEDIGCI